MATDTHWGQGAFTLHSLRIACLCTSTKIHKLEGERNAIEPKGKQASRYCVDEHCVPSQNKAPRNFSSLRQANDATHSNTVRAYEPFVLAAAGYLFLQGNPASQRARRNEATSAVRYAGCVSLCVRT